MSQDNVPELSMDTLLLRIDNIVCATDYLRQAIYELKNIRGFREDVAIKKANAITEVVKTREETNQKLIELYGRMYEDLHSKG